MIEQKVIDKVIIEKSLPENIDTFFVQTFNILFSELDKVTIDIDELDNIILSMGPCTVLELKSRLNSFVDNIAKGKDVEKLRIIMQQKDISKYTLVAENESNEY